MSVIIIRMLPQIGHLNGSFALAKELLDGGHRVIYAHNKKHESYIRKNGFEFFEISQKSEIVTFNIISKKNKIQSVLDVLTNRLKRKLNNKKYKAKIRSKNYFSEMVEALHPDLIILDSSLKIWGIQIAQLNIPFITLQTFVSTMSSKPPRDSYFIPTNLWTSKVRIWLTWRLYYLRRIHFSSPKTLLNLIGGDPEFIKKEIDIEMQGPFAYKNIPEIFTSLYEFDFKHTPLRNHYYFRPLSLFERKDLQYDLLFERQYNLIKNSGRRTIYCSFGSLSWRYQHHEKFIIKLFDLFKTAFTDWNLILCVDNVILKNKLQRQNIPNVYVFHRVPQLLILQQLADVMICHGGMNSIIECIYNKIPLYVIPGSRLYDQIGNAARVEYHKIGLRGSWRESPKTTFEKIRMLVTQESFKNNITSLYHKVHISSDYVNVNDLITNYLNGV